MRAVYRGIVLLIALCAMALQGAAAADLNKAQRAEMRRFAANNSLFVLYHEVAHLLVDQLNLPVLGREEDAADNMATWTLLSRHSREAEQALADAAKGWILSGVAYDSGGTESDYAAAHTLDKQRAYQIVCLMVGSDDKAFQPIANDYALDRDRQDTCYFDYELVKRSFEGLLGTRANKQGAGTKVNVTYHDAGGRLKDAAAAFKSSGVFDQVADELRSRYNVRETVQFNAKRCGEANAFYDPETVEIIFCYELMQDYMDLYEDDITSQAATSETSRQKDKDKPSGAS
ncbi:MAG TPA: DUF4344 domain-containing metallopeptidase [Devosia sp.]|nr:DUF4344 domain-containing metallopeptidase [Devosia sp.]